MGRNLTSFTFDGFRRVGEKLWSEEEGGVKKTDDGTSFK